MSKIFFTSDLHFGHDMIRKYTGRPFHSLENMNKLLVQNWNEVVSSEDTIYVLGDFAMGKIAETLPIAKDLNGHKLLCPGNHDRCWNGHTRPKDIRKLPEWRTKYEEVGFTLLPEQTRLPVNTENGGFEILLCHFPYIGDSHNEDRYKEWRPIDDGTTLLHGHVHSHNKNHGERMIDVGVDANGFYPRTLQELLS